MFSFYALRPLPPAPFAFPGLQFGSLGASFLTFWEPFWYLGTTLEDPWEQSDGHEVANDRIFVDLGVISGFVYVIF